MELGDLKKTDITHWLPFGADGRVLIRYVIKKELMAIEEEANRPSMSQGPLPVSQKKAEENRLLGRAAVRGWENLTVGGKAFEYTPENCDLLMEKSYDFSDFVNLACVQIGLFETRQEEELKKNLKPTSDGS